MGKYSNAKIYKVVCGETGNVYIGATTNSLSLRFHHHRHHTNPTRTKNFINPTIHLLEEYPCENLIELSLKEKEWILKTECVNGKIPLRTPEEYYKDNKIKILEEKRIYYQNNKERILERQKIYYNNNKNNKNNNNKKKLI